MELAVSSFVLDAERVRNFVYTIFKTPSKFPPAPQAYYDFC